VILLSTEQPIEKQVFRCSCLNVQSLEDWTQARTVLNKIKNINLVF